MGINLNTGQLDLLREDLNIGDNRTSIDRFSEAVRRQMDEEAGGGSEVENGASTKRGSEVENGAPLSFEGYWDKH